MYTAHIHWANNSQIHHRGNSESKKHSAPVHKSTFGEAGISGGLPAMPSRVGYTQNHRQMGFFNCVIPYNNYEFKRVTVWVPHL